jgi:hypothetical protein
VWVNEDTQHDDGGGQNILVGKVAIREPVDDSDDIGVQGLVIKTSEVPLVRIEFTIGLTS